MRGAGIDRAVAALEVAPHGFALAHPERAEQLEFWGLGQPATISPLSEKQFGARRLPLLVEGAKSLLRYVANNGSKHACGSAE
jgi:hypothetical protein